MHELPADPRASEDPRHAERPVLLCEIAYRAALALDHDEDGQIAGCVGLDDLDLGPPATEELLESLDRGIGLVEATYGLATVRAHEGVVVCVGDERDIPPDVAGDQRSGGLRDPLDERAQLLVGHRCGHANRTSVASVRRMLRGAVAPRGVCLPQPCAGDTGLVPLEPQPPSPFPGPEPTPQPEPPIPGPDPLPPPDPEPPGPDARRF